MVGFWFGWLLVDCLCGTSADMAWLQAADIRDACLCFIKGLRQPGGPVFHWRGVVRIVDCSSAWLYQSMVACLAAWYGLALAQTTAFGVVCFR
jgi:hypothetical protein